MKKLIIIAIVAVAAFLFFTGRYPVALVGGSPVWFKTWQKAQNAVKNSHKVQASQSPSGGGAINFDDPKNTELLKEVQRNALSALVEDLILYQEGEKEVKDLENLSQAKVNEALKIGNIEQASQFVYGLSLEDFKILILMPQARLEILGEEFTKQNKNFEEWFSGVKKSKSVRLFLVPFSWDGESVK